jgi:hypothetical protein
MAGVEFNPAAAPNNRRRSFQSPQLGAETVSFWTLQKGFLHLAQDFFSQSRLTSSSASRFQCPDASALPSLMPSASRLAAHLQEPNDLGLRMRLALLENLDGFQSTDFQSHEVPAGSNADGFHARILPPDLPSVTILCEGQ